MLPVKGGDGGVALVPRLKPDEPGPCTGAGRAAHKFCILVFGMELGKADRKPGFPNLK